MLRSVFAVFLMLWTSGVAAGVPLGSEIWQEYEGDYPLVLERSGVTLKLSMDSGSTGITFDDPIRFEGKVDGDKIVGVMPVYVRKSCTKTSFKVEGTYTASRIVVHGNEPYLDKNGCIRDKTARKEFVFKHVFTAVGSTGEKVPVWGREKPIRETILQDALGMIETFASRSQPGGDDVNNNILNTMISGMPPEGLGIGDCVISAYDLPDFSSGEDRFVYDYLHRIADAEIDKKSLTILGYPKEFVERVLDVYTRASLETLLCWFPRRTEPVRRIISIEN